MVSSWWAAARVGQHRALSLKGAQPMRLTVLILFWWPGEDRVELPVTGHFASCIGMQKGCDKRNLNFNSSSKRKKLTSAASRRPISTTHTDSPSGDMRYTELTEQTDPKVECLHLLKPAYHPQRSRDQRKLTRNTSPRSSFSQTRNLTICNLYSPPNKAINLQILQPNSEDWMIVGDFNSHSPCWGYPSLDAKWEEVEYLSGTGLSAIKDLSFETLFPLISNSHLPCPPLNPDWKHICSRSPIHYAEITVTDVTGHTAVIKRM